MADRWRDERDDEYTVRVDFPDGTVAYTTIELAADRLEFIDRDKGIADLKAGTVFRSGMGSMYQMQS